MPAEVFYIQSRRAERMRRVQIAQHLVAAFVLITAAWDHLTAPHGQAVVLPVLELLAGAALIGSVVMEKVRHRRGAPHGRIAWVELAGAAMVFVEALGRLQQKHHTLFYVLAFVQPVMHFFFAVFDLQLARRRYLKADDHGFEIHTRVLFGRRVPWSGIREYRIEPKAIAVIGEDDRVRRLSIRDIRNRDEALAWVRERFAGRGVTEASTAAGTATSPAARR